MAEKVTVGAQILTTYEATELMSKYANAIINDTEKFKKKILDLLKDVVIKRNYRNEKGIIVLGQLLTRQVETEIKVDSKTDKRLKYYCVKFISGGYACTCSSFITYCNAFSPKKKCKHIQSLIEKERF